MIRIILLCKQRFHQLTGNRSIVAPSSYRAWLNHLYYVQESLLAKFLCCGGSWPGEAEKIVKQYGGYPLSNFGTYLIA